MKTKLSRRTKRAICIYIAALLILYIVVQVLPKVTDIFETTQVLEPGNLKISYDTTGYFVKEESVGIAAESGEIQCLVSTGTAVKKGHKVISIEAESSDDEPRFSKYTERLEGYSGLTSEYEAAISGIFSLTIDGYEDYLTPDNVDKVKRETVESLSYDSADLKRDSAIKGEPIYKITMDDYWYILCWVDADTAESYYEGQSITVELPEGSIDASIYSLKEEDEDYRVVIYANVYYEALCESRAEKISIITSDKEGLIVNNNCIVDKDGYKGVYVKNKNGNYVFKRVQIISSNSKQSVLTDSTFTDEDGNQVYTVNVYDEVLKHPASALAKDLAEEEEEEESDDDSGESDESSDESESDKSE